MLIFTFIPMVSGLSVISEYDILMTAPAIDRGLMVTSSGNYHAVYLNRSGAVTNVFHAWSTDDGETWTHQQITNLGSDAGFCNAVMDNDNRIHLLYTRASTREMEYRRWDGNSWENHNQSITSGVGKGELGTITVDRYNNVYCLYGATTLYYRKYTDSLGTWSAEATIQSGGSWGYHSADTDSSGNVWLGVIDASNKLRMYRYDSNLVSWTYTGDIDTLSSNDLTVAVDTDNIPHAVYVKAYSGDESIYHAYNSSGTSFITERVHHTSGHDCHMPTLVANYNGDLTCLWYSTTGDSASPKIQGKTKSGGSWGNYGYYSIGTDAHYKAVAMHQNYPTFMRTFSGVAFMFDNDTDTNLMFETDDNFIPYGQTENNTIIPNCGIDGIGIVGIIEDGAYYVTDCPFLWFRYNIEEYMNISRIDLQVETAMYDSGLDADNFQCKINNNYLGGADSWSYVGDGAYALTWTGLDAEITGISTIMFRALIPYISNQYWAVPYTEDDINNDNDVGFDIRFISDDYFWNNFLNPDVYNEYPSFVFRYENDLIMRMCVERGAVDIHNYTNFVDCTPSQVQRYNPVDITYICNETSMGFTRYVYIEINGTVVEQYFIPDGQQSGHFYYTPTSDGDYYVNLSINGINVTGDTFICSGLPDNYIYTEPNPSLVGGFFNIHYRYNFTANTGRIRIIDNNGDVERTYTVNALSEGTYSTSLNSQGQYIVILSIYVNNQSDVEIANARHIVGTMEYNSIHMDEDTILRNEEITIFGEHSHIGQNVFIKVGNSYVTNVGDTSPYTFDFVADNSGVFEVTLALVAGNQEIELASAGNLYVSEDSIYGEDEDFEFFGIPSVFMNAMFGAFITLAFLVIPFAVTKGEASNMIYAIFGGVGLGISTIMGLFPLWLPLLVAILVFAVMIFEYKKD